MSDAFKPLKVLMVEDDLDLCQGWMDIFTILGHELITHQRAAEALKDEKSIREADLFITDYYLPDMNGVDLIRRIQSVGPKIPAILLTGSRESSVLEAAKALPNCTILYKPLSIDDIEKELESLRLSLSKTG